MSEAFATKAACDVRRFESVCAGAAGAWLRLAAAPTFAVMALLTGVDGSGSSNFICSTAPNASPFSGMATMYLLMSVFHLPAWLKLILGRPTLKDTDLAA